VPTKHLKDAKLVPFSFKWKDDSFLNVTGLNLVWSCKIILSGLCQNLYACGVPIEWPTLADLQAEERRCAMLIAMSTDYFASLAPYACIVALENLQRAWGVYWRQKNYCCGHDDNGMAEWLRRRGNEFLYHINGEEMHSTGLVVLTELLMGGPPVLQLYDLNSSETTNVT